MRDMERGEKERRRLQDKLDKERGEGGGGGRCFRALPCLGGRLQPVLVAGAVEAVSLGRAAAGAARQQCCCRFLAGPFSCCVRGEGPHARAAATVKRLHGAETKGGACPCMFLRMCTGGGHGRPQVRLAERFACRAPARSLLVPMVPHVVCPLSLIPPPLRPPLVPPPPPCSQGGGPQAQGPGARAHAVVRVGLLVGARQGAHAVGAAPAGSKGGVVRHQDGAERAEVRHLGWLPPGTQVGRPARGARPVHNGPMHACTHAWVPFVACMGATRWRQAAMPHATHACMLGTALPGQHALCRRPASMPRRVALPTFASSSTLHARTPCCLFAWSLD